MMLTPRATSSNVIPAKAGTPPLSAHTPQLAWMPACAGMTAASCTASSPPSSTSWTSFPRRREPSARSRGGSLSTKHGLATVAPSKYPAPCGKVTWVPACAGMTLRATEPFGTISQMFATFFHELKAAKVPVTLKEYLTLMEAMQADLADRSVEHFYYLSRATLVKDERHLDKFDQVFGHVFKGLELMREALETQIPEEWLRSLAQLYLSEEEKAKIEALGGWDKIMEELKKRLEEQKGRHQGGKKWIGTGGTSPYGADGYNPAGVRIGQKTGRQGRAIKVWDKREYKDLDDTVELGTRNIKIALRRLRKFAREGRARRARPRRHHQGHRAQGLPRHPHAARAAQHREGADVLRHRRLHGLAHQDGGGAVLGRAHRVQAPGIFLLPQLPLRVRVEGQRAAAGPSARPPGRCCTSTRPTTRWCSSATPP